MTPKFPLPKEAEAFLRPRKRRLHRNQLVRFHRWMEKNNLELSDLSPAHIELFWKHERSRNLAKPTLFSYQCRQHSYLYWLYNKGHIRFTVEPPLEFHTQVSLPKFTWYFLRTGNNIKYKNEIRIFHSWLNRKEVALSELTSSHIDVYLRRPINTELSRKESRDRHFYLLAPYLEWLFSRGYITLDIDRPGRRAFPLPVSATNFVNTLRPVRRSSTCDGYETDLRDLHSWLDGQNIALKDINRDDMERWLKSLSDRELTATTRNSRIGHIHRYFEWLFEKELIDGHPDFLLRSSDLSKVPSYLPRPYPPQADRQMQKRFRECGCIYCQALLLMRQTGIRMGELVTLEYYCVDEDHLGNNFLKVPLGKLLNERLVPLTEETSSLIQTLQKQSGPEAPFLLVPDINRETLKLRLATALRKAAEGLEIPGAIVSHRLRHSYATELLNGGMSFPGIMKLLGHRSFKMTMRYAAITQETIVNDYKKALEQSESQYRHYNKIHTPKDISPNRLLLDVINWFRKNHCETKAQKRRSDAIIKRIHRIRKDISDLEKSAHTTNE